MDAFEFITNYPTYLDEIEQIVKPELLPILVELREIDPHDLVTPDTWIVSELQARGFVWMIFLKKCQKRNITTEKDNQHQTGETATPVLFCAYFHNFGVQVKL